MARRLRFPTRGRPSRHRRSGRRLDRLAAAVASWSPRRRLAVGGSAVAVVVAAVVLALVLPSSGGGRTPPTPPAPQAHAQPERVVETPTHSAPARPKHDKPFTCRKPSSEHGSAAPQRVCIPGIQVDASVMKLGLNRDRTVEVPPLSRVRDAGWYRYSAAPGAVGPTVVLGHVDSAQYGDGVFFRLGTVRAGDTVVISRDDGKIATFVVNRVDEVSKKSFPTDSVYGATSGPAIRLVTCGGKFNSSSGSYEDNIIAYGTLRSLRQA